MNCYIHSNREASCACSNCGKFICQECATEIESKSYCRNCLAALAMKKQTQGNSSRRITAALLAFFLGGLGIHKFYLGQNGAGVLYLVFCWTCIPALIALIDGIILVSMSDDAFQAKYN